MTICGYTTNVSYSDKTQKTSETKCLNLVTKKVTIADGRTILICDECWDLWFARKNHKVVSTEEYHE